MTVQDAVVLLGFNATRNTVMSISIFRALNHGSTASGFNMKDFWQHSIATGMVARYLARKLHVDAEKAFSAGIVHDIGKIILQQYFQDELEKVLKVVHEKHISFYDAEIEVYRGTHCDLGSYLADKWNLPIPLIEVIDLHHTPGEATEDPRLVSIVHISNNLCKSLGMDFIESAKKQEIDPYAFARLDLTANEVESWLDEIQNEINQAEDMFQNIQ